MIEKFTYEVTQLHRHTNRYGRWDRKIHQISAGTMTEEAEVGTQTHALMSLRYANSSCTKCPWGTASQNPMGRCKNCSVIWIWEPRIHPLKTSRTINENGKKVGDTVWFNKMTGEPANCLDCGTQLIRTSRGNLSTHSYKALI